MRIEDRNPIHARTCYRTEVEVGLKRDSSSSSGARADELGINETFNLRW